MYMFLGCIYSFVGPVMLWNTWGQTPDTVFMTEVVCHQTNIPILLQFGQQSNH